MYLPELVPSFFFFFEIQNQIACNSVMATSFVGERKIDTSVSWSPYSLSLLTFLPPDSEPQEQQQVDLVASSSRETLTAVFRQDGKLAPVCLGHS